MASDIPPPADHSAMFSDPEPLAEKWQDVADQAWREMGGSKRGSDEHRKAMDQYEHAARQVQYYRRMAARGEKVPVF